jgi:proteic killer suppression protein
MIRDFAHKGLGKFFMDGTKTGIQAKHEKRLRLILFRLNTATAISNMAYPGSGVHPLKGNLKGYWAVSVSGNWRVTFRFDNGDAFGVDYLDYH